MPSTSLLPNGTSVAPHIFPFSLFPGFVSFSLPLFVCLFFFIQLTSVFQVFYNRNTEPIPKVYLSKPEHFFNKRKPSFKNDGY